MRSVVHSIVEVPRRARLCFWSCLGLWAVLWAGLAPSAAEAQMSTRVTVAPPDTPSVRLQTELRDILRDWAAGDESAPERWSEVQVRTYDNIVASNRMSFIRKRVAIECLEAVEGTTFEPLYEHTPEVALLRIELRLRSLAAFRHAGRVDLASSSWSMFEPILEDVLQFDEAIDRRLEPTPGRRPSVRAEPRFGSVVNRTLVQVADSLVSLRLISFLERARTIYGDAARRARRAVEESHGRSVSDGLVLDASLYWEANLALREGEDSTAREALDEAIERRPDLGELRLLRAMTFRRLGREGAANEELERIVTMVDDASDRQAPAWVRRVAWQERVDLASGEEARDLVRQGLEEFPDDRGLRLQALALDVLLPPTVVDAGSYLGDALAARPGATRISSRFRTEHARRIEVDQVRRRVATDLAATLAILPAALETLDARERVEGRPEITKCERAFDER